MSHAGNGITRPAPGISEGMGAGDRRPPARKKHLRPVRTAGPSWSGANGPFRQSIFHRFSDVSTVAPSADCLRSRRIGVGRPSLKGGITEKDFIGFTVLSTPLFPLKGEASTKVFLMNS